MNHGLSTRSRLLISVCFAVPLAILGFQVAAWWGVIGGALVGAMLASRVLVRRATSSDTPAILLIPQASDDTAEIDARRVARLKHEFDRAVFDSSDLSAKQPALH